MAKIIFLEDDAHLGHDLSQTLREFGHSVAWCGLAADARELMEQENFDILITDVMILVDGTPMPDGGITLIHWVRQRESGRAASETTGIIAITGLAQRQGLEQILDTTRLVGADFAIEKPIDTRLLIEQIDRLARRRAETA